MGGSWLLFNKKTFNIAFLTNYDQSPIQRFGLNKKSRGQLILDFVHSDSPYHDEQSSVEYLQQIASDKDHYNPLLLVVGNLK